MEPVAMTEKIYDKTLQNQIIQTNTQSSLTNVNAELIATFAKLLLALIKEYLIRDGSVRIHQFGTFRLKPASARRVYNPQTGQIVLQPAKTRVMFLPAKALRDKIEAHPAPTQILHTPEQNQPAPPHTQNPITLPSGFALQIPGWESNIEHPFDLAANNKNPEMDPDTLSQSAFAAMQLRNPATNSQPPLQIDLPVTAKSPAEYAAHVPDPASMQNKATEKDSTTIQQRNISPLAWIKEPIRTEQQQSLASETETYQTRQAAPVHTANGYEQKTVWNLSSPRFITGCCIAVLLLLLFLWLYQNNTRLDQANPIATVATLPQQIPIAPLQTHELTHAATAATQNHNPQTATPSSPVQISRAKTTAFFLERHYQIRRGDNLWKLSRKNYLNPFLWPHIYRANYGQLSNPDRLETQNTIILPMLKGKPSHLTLDDRRNIAEGYFLLYQHYRKIAYPQRHHALIAVKWFDAQVLSQHQNEIDSLDISKLSAKRQDNLLIKAALSRSLL